MAEIGTSIVAKIVEYLVEPTLRQLRYMFCFNNIVEDLRQENRKLTVAQEQVQIDVKRARGNAEEIRKDVEKWLTDSNAVTEDVKSLENEAQDNKSSLNGWCPNWCCRYRLSRKAAKKKLAIIKLQEDGKFTQVGDPASLPNPGFFSSTDFLSSKATESATHQIMEALKDENVNMIGLHGMGGTGKTTLVKDLGGRAKELKLFDVVVIAVVSQTPNVKNIQGEIADPLRLEFHEETESGRAGRLRVRLKSENKILIILDDVWDHLELTEIGIPFGNDHKGCKILLTTRRHHVCIAMKSQKTIKLDVLLEHEAWALFKKNTGLGNDSSTLTTMAMEVARECKGLPLAIVTVGRALRGKTLDEYTVALEQLKHSRFVNIQDVDKDVYACLKLSYDYLKRREIQSCFLLCSLFPEDYEIGIEILARIGWGIGLFQEADTIEAARREMRVMMKTLQNSGLLIDTDRDQFVKMHDMVRDVALWIASEGENVFMVRTGAGLKTWPHDRSLEPCTAISLMANRIEELPNGLVCPNLNTLLLVGDSFSMTISDIFFEEMKALKVLSVFGGILVPQSLQFLTNLQTLHLDYCKFNDISSLGKLKKLGILRLCGSDIEELPNEIGELNNLRLLDVTGCRYLKRIPPFVISKLSKLEELYIEFPTRGWIWGPVPVKLAFDWLCELNSLSHLAVLSLQFDAKLPIGFAFPKLTRYNINMINSNMKYPTSRTLGFRDIDATSLNAFKELFPAVECLHLERAVGFQNIIPNLDQGGLNDLISLRLNFCCEMECMIDSTQQQQVATHHVAKGNHVILLSNLTSLHLNYLPKLMSIWKGPTQYVSLQSLRDVEVSRCEKLTYLFSSSLARSLVQLKRLKVHGCRELEQIIITEKECMIDSTQQQQVPIHVSLQSLRDIEVSNCGKLTYLFSSSLARSLVQLQRLKIHDCMELEQIIITEKECMIDSTQQQQVPTHVSLQSLRDVEVSNCEKLTYLFSSSLARNLVQLQRLKIHHCKGLEQIIITEKEDGEISSEAHLQPLCFPKLTTLDISHCNKLEYIFPISVNRDLQLLEVLIISHAPQLKQVFSHGKKEDLFVGNGNSILLPKLTKLKLETLSSLTSFCEDNYHWVWPSLQELNVMKCPKLRTSFTADLEANLSTLQKQLRVLRIGNHIQLHEAVILHLRQGLQNCEELGIENCEEIQEVFHGISTDGDSKLEKLNLKDLPELRVIWKSPTQISGFQNLTDIYVINCNKLMHVFSPSVARNLPQLECLDIRGCEELERIIGEEDKDEEDQIISSKGHLQQPIRFPNLKTITVKGCNKLKSLFPINIAGGLPQLELLSVERASQFEEVFRHENEEDVRDEKKIVLQQLIKLMLIDLPRLISFCPGGYHFIFPILGLLQVKGCPNITTSFTIESVRSVHAKAKAETPQLAKEDMSEGSSTTQATVAAMPNDNDIYIQWLCSSEWDPLPPPSYSNINWDCDLMGDTLPPYVEESPGNL